MGIKEARLSVRAPVSRKDHAGQAPVAEQITQQCIDLIAILRLVLAYSDEGSAGSRGQLQKIILAGVQIVAQGGVVVGSRAVASEQDVWPIGNEFQAFRGPETGERLVRLEEAPALMKNGVHRLRVIPEHSLLRLIEPAGI